MFGFGRQMRVVRKIVPVLCTWLAKNISNRGLAIGVYGAAEDVGILTGPLVIGYLYQGYSAEFSFFFSAALMVANTVIAIPLFRKAA